MKPTINAVRLGLQRGWVEHRQWLRSPDELAWTLLMAGAFVVVLFFQRNSTVEGTGQSLASIVLPSILGMLAGFSGVMGAAGTLAVEREDGTLLRAKAIPHGMVGYLVAKVTTTALGGLVSLVIVLVAGLFLVPELLGQSWRHLETVGVLGAWAVAGLLLAPPILRRMARRESGSAMEERRHRAMQRVG